MSTTIYGRCYEGYLLDSIGAAAAPLFLPDDDLPDNFSEGSAVIVEVNGSRAGLPNTGIAAVITRTGLTNWRDAISVLLDQEPMEKTKP